MNCKTMLQHSQWNEWTQEKKTSGKVISLWCVYMCICVHRISRICPLSSLVFCWELITPFAVFVDFYFFLIKNGYISSCQPKLRLRIVLMAAEDSNTSWNVSPVFGIWVSVQIPCPLHNMVNPVICFLIASTCKAGMRSANIPEISPVCHTTGLVSNHNCIPEQGYTALNVYNISLQQLETDCTSWVGEKISWGKLFFSFLISLQVLLTLALFFFK